MSQPIEEAKHSPVREASAQTTGESDTVTIRMRTDQHIDEYKKLKLINAVDLGLSIGRASAIVCMTSATAQNVIN